MANETNESGEKQRGADEMPVNTSEHSMLPKGSSSSSESCDYVLDHLIEELGRSRGCCRGPVTQAGKRRQIARVMSLLLLSMLALLVMSGYFVAETLMINKNNEQTRRIIEFSIELGDVLQMLQLERDQSVLYLSNIGPATKTYLLKQYLDTDEYIYHLSMWPGELQSNTEEYVRSRRAFVMYLTQHRNSIDLSNHTVFDEIVFYNRMIRVFHKWLYNTLEESRYSNMWKTLVAYQKIIFARLYVGVERALGSYFFSKGGFVEHSTYEWYNEGMNMFRHSFKQARNFSKLVKPMASYDIAMISGKNLSTNIDAYRHQIQYQNLDMPSLADAQYWFDNVTSFLDILFNIQTELAKEILRLVNNKQSITLRVLVMSILFVCTVVAMIPALIQAIHKTTSDIQSYAIILAKESKELDREGARVGVLLDQMVPKEVATQLKQGRAVHASHYRSVTMFFSEMVGFTQINKQVNPLELVSILNHLYTLLDSQINKFDVYKVETNGASFMIASGLPIKNGDRHAFEIANMSLALLETVQNAEIQDASKDCFQIRIGVHTGPVVAGIVGSNIRRYCIFGETVNIASRVENSGLGNRINVSGQTHSLLDAKGRYNMQPHGLMDMQDILGKEYLKTYWLLGHHTGPIPTAMKETTVMTKLNASTLSVGAPTPDRSNVFSSNMLSTHSSVHTGDGSDGQDEHITPSQGMSDCSMMSSYQNLVACGTGTAITPVLSFDAIEKAFKKRQSPPILQLQEGFHF